ncbi:TIGR04338 family metallohydrolase [Williamsia phyllosphaerae]|uniref:TIGR04338 family metallohydrolase n=1 Tax=Williamsia phyllosphaerae TaxID=885042 RepID=A0ABQ1UNE7_9NOCA|nr:TIGR04338 family metallohydrolase [Williamsia phyllosphaerae]GGF23256.1 hypothetical protein GCM10007298_18990 [Williamsia phyllosphaerae]
MTGAPRDTQRALFYEAESAVHNLFAAPGPTVEIAGAQLTLPPEARFGSVESARRYVSQVLSRDSVRRRFPRATIDVEVRSRRGHRSAHYESPADPTAPPTIALPEMADGRWALRELVVLHELAHHLIDPGHPAHGPRFAATLIDLVSDVLGPEAGFVYRVILTDSGIAVR